MFALRSFPLGGWQSWEESDGRRVLVAPDGVKSVLDFRVYERPIECMHQLGGVFLAYEDRKLRLEQQWLRTMEVFE